MNLRYAAAAFLAALPLLAQAPAASPTPRPTPKPRAPSLADVVKRSQTTKQTTKKKSLGVITNESVKSHDTSKAVTRVDGKVSVPGAGPAGVPPPTPDTTVRDNEGRTEQDWRQRAATLRRDAVQARERVRKLEAETKRLENDFYAWSDGNYRDGVIKPSWDKAREDLKAARTELDAAETALTNLEDDARKAGAPPGWLR
jgi:hypothetical protein